MGVFMNQTLGGQSDTLYSVKYIDALSGASGLIRVLRDELPAWLREHPGCLIVYINVV